MPTDLPPPPGPPGPQGPYDPYRPYDPYQPPEGMPQPYGRRRSNTTVILVIALAAVVAATLVTVAIVLTPGEHDELGRTARQLQIQQVIASSPGGCAGADTGVSSLDGTMCYQLAPGLTVTDFERIDVVTSGAGGWAIRIYLLPPDAVVFERLTARVFQEPPPRNQLALVVAGNVVSSPTVQGPIPGGRVQIEGRFTRDAAKRIADQLDG